MYHVVGTLGAFIVFLKDPIIGKLKINNQSSKSTFLKTIKLVV